MDVHWSCMYTQSLSWKIMGLLVHMANDFGKKNLLCEPNKSSNWFPSDHYYCIKGIVALWSTQNSIELEGLFWERSSSLKNVFTNHWLCGIFWQSGQQLIFDLQKKREESRVEYLLFITRNVSAQEFCVKRSWISLLMRDGSWPFTNHLQLLTEYSVLAREKVDHLVHAMASIPYKWGPSIVRNTQLSK